MARIEIAAEGEVTNPPVDIEAALEEAFAARPPVEPRPTIGDNFLAAAKLIKEAKVDYRLTEGTLIKLFELQLLWAMNNREQQPYGGSGFDEAPDLPEPTEYIAGEPDEETTDGS